MSECFSEILKKSLSNKKIKVGDIIKGKIISISNKYILVDVGLKSEGNISIDQFKSDGCSDIDNIKINDEIDVMVEALVDDFGETKVSYEKAKKAAAWVKLTSFHENDEIVNGLIMNRIKGGFSVDLFGIKAFLPGSLVDIRPVMDVSKLIGSKSDFKIIKIDEKRNNIVVSRKAIFEGMYTVERDKIIEQLKEGAIIKGIVKNITDYGVFIDLGGIDGLLHITDITWRRIKHPGDILKLNQEVESVVLKFDKDSSRLSLGMKQLHEDPWGELKQKYPKNTKISGRVTNIADYGYFVEIEKGIEGLVHTSEMGWAKKDIHPSKVVQIGQEVDVVMLSVDLEKRRISLGASLGENDPWIIFCNKNKIGDKIAGKIKAITKFGLFVDLDNGIDGLIHISDLTWEKANEKIFENYKKDDFIESVIIGIDQDRKRISLGIKQLTKDPLEEFEKEHENNSEFKSEILEISNEFILFKICNGITSKIKIPSINSYNELIKTINVSDIVDLKLLSINLKNRSVKVCFDKLEKIELLNNGSDEKLSVDDKYQPKLDKAATENVVKTKKNDQSIKTATLGDILQDQLSKK